MLAGAAQAAQLAVGGKKRPLALILEPTRDLAEQTHNALVELGQHLPNRLTSVLVTGESLCQLCSSCSVPCHHIQLAIWAMLCLPCRHMWLVTVHASPADIASLWLTCKACVLCRAEPATSKPGQSVLWLQAAGAELCARAGGLNERQLQQEVAQGTDIITGTPSASFAACLKAAATVACNPATCSAYPQVQLSCCQPAAASSSTLAANELPQAQARALTPQAVQHD